MAIIDTQTFSRSRHAYTFVRIVTAGGHVLRATVHRDFYEHQCRGTVERFDGTRWHEVISQPSEKIWAVTRSTSADEYSLVQSCEKAAEPLLELAQEIIEAATA